MRVGEESARGGGVTTREVSALWAWGLCALLGLPPALLAVFQLGRLHPDELFQFLEPALHRAFGFGVLAWEWKEGLRNWAIPGIFAGLLKLCAFLGIEHPQARRAVLEVPQYLLHVCMLHAVYRMCLRRLPWRVALWGPVCLGSYGVVVHFAGRTMSETFSTIFLVWAVERLDALGCEEGEVNATRATAAGVLLGLTVVARYGSAVFVLAILLELALRRRRVALRGVTLGGGVVALGLFALDWATWGKPAHSLMAYLGFNVLSDKAAHTFGESGPVTYVNALIWMAPWTPIGLVLALRRWRLGRPSLVVPFLLGSGLLYLAVLLATLHKEARFLYPAFVGWGVATLPPVLDATATRAAWWAQSLRAALVALGLVSFFVMSPFHVRRPAQFRMTVKAGTSPGVTGVLVLGEPWLWRTGGYFYLGKDLPWQLCAPNQPNFARLVREPRFNRAITWDGQGIAELERAGFRVLETDGKATLLGR